MYRNEFFLVLKFLRYFLIKGYGCMYFRIVWGIFFFVILKDILVVEFLLYFEIVSFKIYFFLILSWLGLMLIIVDVFRCLIKVLK